MFVRNTIDPEKSQRYPRVTPELPVHSVARAMAQARLGAALVVEGGTLVGIFTERDLIIRVLGPGKPLAQTPVGDVMTASPDIHENKALIFSALDIMAEKHYRHGFVKRDDGDIPEVVTQKDFIRYCWNRLSPRKKKALCQKYLAADIARTYNDATHRHLIDVSASAGKALSHMMEKRTGSLLVVHEERLCGIFTERDVLMRLVAPDLAFENARLISVSTLTPNVITPEVNIATIMRLLLEKNYRRIPITLMGKPLGMVTQRNIAYLLRDEFAHLFGGLPWNK